MYKLCVAWQQYGNNAVHLCSCMHTLSNTPVSSLTLGVQAFNSDSSLFVLLMGGNFQLFAFDEVWQPPSALTSLHWPWNCLTSPSAGRCTPIAVDCALPRGHKS